MVLLLTSLPPNIEADAKMAMTTAIQMPIVRQGWSRRSERAG
jgi:hypothetical protein